MITNEEIKEALIAQDELNKIADIYRIKIVKLESAFKLLWETLNKEYYEDINEFDFDIDYSSLIEKNDLYKLIIHSNTFISLSIYQNKQDINKLSCSGNYMNSYFVNDDFIGTLYYSDLYDYTRIRNEINTIINTNNREKEKKLEIQKENRYKEYLVLKKEFEGS